MAKRRYQRRTRAGRFGQLMLLAAALMNMPVCLAEQEIDAVDASKTAVAEQSSRELLLYLGEFDPELDPVEISQLNDALAADPAIKTETKTAAEASTDAAIEPKH